MERNPIGDGRAGYRIAKLLNLVVEQGIDYLVANLRDKLKIDLVNPLVVTKVLPRGSGGLSRLLNGDAIKTCLTTPLCVKNNAILGAYNDLFSSMAIDNINGEVCDFYMCKGTLDNPEQYIHVDWNKITRVIDSL